MSDTQTSVSPGESLYDMLMREIEPELTSDQLPLLEKRYEGESEEQKTARAKRYYEAFEEYERRLAALESDCDQILRRNMRTALASLEEKDRTEEFQKFAAIFDGLA